MSNSATHLPPAISGDEAVPSSRWRTSARIEELNQQQAARERAAKLASRRWATLHAKTAPQVALDSLGQRRLRSLEANATLPTESRRLLTDDRVPSWLVSLIIHMVIVLLLAFLTFKGLPGDRGQVISATWRTVETPADSLQMVVSEAMPSDTDATTSDDPEQALLDTEEVEFAAVVELEHPLDSRQELVGQSLFQRVFEQGREVSLMSQFTGGKLGDRSSAGRAAALAAGDTTAAAEDALEQALRWLAEHQHNDGGWSFRLDDKNGPCAGQCDHERKNPDDAPIPRTAATGLAMLAFMGAGSTHQQGPYAEQVRRGLYYLQGQARETSLGTDLQNGSMYGHGIATLAIAEAFVLSGDEELRPLAEGTAFFCFGSRHSSGGWGYLPGGPADITLTAWQIVAIKTAEQRGVGIPTDLIPKAQQFVETLASDRLRRYGYNSPEPRLSTTAIGLLLQLYFGYMPNQTTIREGLDRIVEAGPSETDVYYNYYAMLGLHHGRHVGRMEFARKLQEYLVATQARQGHEKGSWHFPDRYGDVGGRLYTTAMCALILETPYRYVPMQAPDGPFKL